MQQPTLLGLFDDVMAPAAVAATPAPTAPAPPAPAGVRGAETPGPASAATTVYSFSMSPTLRKALRLHATLTGQEMTRVVVDAVQQLLQQPHSFVGPDQMWRGRAADRRAFRAKDVPADLPDRVRVAAAAQGTSAFEFIAAALLRVLDPRALREATR